MSIEQWIEWLKKTGTKEEWHPIVKEMAKAFDIRVGEAYEKLKTAGWEPKTAKLTPNLGTAGTGAAASGNDQQGADAANAGTDDQPKPKAAQGNGGNPNAQGGSTQKVILRHKTAYPQYRRAGLILTQKVAEYEVTDKQLAILKKDSWVIVGDGKKEGDGE
ncbi:MAG: hypothetical protein LBN21_00845 [Treponema sp.]|nr:hypothetical protein [Treponema sp.]